MGTKENMEEEDLEQNKSLRHPAAETTKPHAPESRTIRSSRERRRLKQLVHKCRVVADKLARVASISGE